MKTIILYVLVLLYAPLLLAVDKSGLFSSIYHQEIILENSDLEALSDIEIVLIPGIISETFSGYFGAQHFHYEKLGLKASRLEASSKSVEETIEKIDEKVRRIKKAGRKVLFISHSLGGLALVDWMMKQDEKSLKIIKGIAFIQSPFFGAPVATVYLENPYYARTLLGPILPFFNTSIETIKYLSVEERRERMKSYLPRLQKLLKSIPVITAGGVSLKHPSIFLPSLNVIGYGCLTYVKQKCLSKKVFKGPFDDSDGMVPFESSKLPFLDFVKLEGVDHGETVLPMPFMSIDRVKMTDVLLKMLL
ncbi:MAG: hypothetical protein ACLGHN_11575 [Bacteriovoracia bacterium]